MTHQILSLLMFATMLLALLQAHTILAAPRCFPGTPGIDNCIDGRIRTFWEQQGGLPVFGYPIGPLVQQQSAEGSIDVQLFERARLELHPNSQAPYDVLLGRLGADALASQGAGAAPEGPRAGCLFFAETGQNICPPFLQTWRRYGLNLGQPGVTQAESLALFGLPLGPAQVAPLADGTTGMIQWFERARFEDHGSQGVLLGLLGREFLGQPQPMRSETQVGGFIQVAGDQLTRLGQPVQLKGANYYPQTRPWGEMWTNWDAPQTERELRQARDDLDINTIRILVPFYTNDEGQPWHDLIIRIKEFAQIAGKLDIRLIVALFDFEQDFPRAGTREEQTQLVYLRTLIGNFVGDDRIIAWDLHNEPDQYKMWLDGGAPQVLDWLGRMADEVHRLDPNHLVTVGPARYDNLYQPGPDGRRIIDYTDVISWHNYNAADTDRQLHELRRHTNKPIILEEFGWPSEYGCLVRAYSEQTQMEVYRDMLTTVRGRVSGVLAWALRNFDSGPTRRWDEPGEYYGLYRSDGSLKPAAQYLRDYPGGPLPSAVQTDLPLTSDGPVLPGGIYAPLFIDGSGHYVKREFRRAWQFFGGQASLGLPLTEAFEQPTDKPHVKKVVQYFEYALLEYHPEVAGKPDFPLLSEPDQIAQLIVPVPIGAAYTAERGYNGQFDIKGAFNQWYKQYNGRWRLGVAISGELTEDVDGTPLVVQYFQRGRLELNPATGLVQPGQLGRWAWAQQCGAAK